MNAVAPHLAVATEVAAPDMVAAAIAGACRRIAPLWPLQRFVAVNPFLGFAERPFDEACAALRRVTGAGMVMPLGFYREALATGAVTDADLEAALSEAPAGLPTSAAGLRLALADAADAAPGAAAMPSVAETIDRLTGDGRRLSRATLMIDEISKWCAAWFDRGQAVWPLPGQGGAPWPAWRAAMRHDRTAEVAGVAGFRRAVAALPAEPAAAVAAVAAALGVPLPALEDYLHRALFDIRGWAAYARHRVGESELRGRPDEIMTELLAIRTAWDYALFQGRRDERFRSAWRSALVAAGTAGRAGPDLALRLALVLQDAYERARRRVLLAPLADVAAAVAMPARPALQVVFCIDVRSEPYRRALEAAGPEIRTLGFAGFFGLPVEHVPLGAEHATPHCPVLLAPAIRIEEVAGRWELERRLARGRAATAWRAFKLGAVSSFAFVETAGLIHAGKLLGRTFGLGGRSAPGRSAAPLAAAGLDPRSGWQRPRRCCAACH
ncbi:MAG: putative inorganic carbon transporter subunit DabA [Dongiaceae bacterium]